MSGEPVGGTNAYPEPPPCRSCGRHTLGARGPASGGVIEVVCANCGDSYRYGLAEPAWDDDEHHDVWGSRGIGTRDEMEEDGLW